MAYNQQQQPYGGAPPPAYSNQPGQGRPGGPPSVPSGTYPQQGGGYAPPGGPPPGQGGYPPQSGHGQDDQRGLGGLAVGLGAAALAGHAVQSHQQGQAQQQGGYGQQPGYPPAGGATGLGRSGTTEDPLTVLRRFDTVIVVDDSASMQQQNRWGEAEQALRAVAEKIVQYDSDGIDVYFLNSTEYLQGAKSAQQVTQLFQRVRPVGQSTPTEVRVEELLGMYLDRLEQTKAHGAAPLKPLNLIVLTDGQADDPDTLSYALASFAERLDQGRFPLTQLGVQFLQIGNDPEATRALQALDDELKGTGQVKRDIVDTTPYQGRITGDFVVKVLLGGINRRIDRN